MLDNRAADIMTSPVVYVMSETPVRDIARVLLDHRISAVPVIGEGGRLVGIVSEGDLVRRAAADDGKRRSWWLDMFEKSPFTSDELRNYLEHHGLRAKDVMSSDVVAVDQDTPIAAVAELPFTQKARDEIEEWQLPAISLARIVSGYLYNPAQNTVGSRGAGSTHAWAEVYVPGAGWITFDPTNRSVGGSNLIPVAVARNIVQALPVAGSFVGMTDAFQDMSVEVLVTSVA